MAFGDVIKKLPPPLGSNCDIVPELPEFRMSKGDDIPEFAEFPELRTSKGDVIMTLFRELGEVLIMTLAR